VYGIGILVYKKNQNLEPTPDIKLAKYIWYRNFSLSGFRDLQNISGIGILVLGVLQILGFVPDIKLANMSGT
jgi:hypothetical protein